MARIRTIKPEFWTDERLSECSVSARLLFIGTWNYSDDAGNLERSSKQLKARIFPYDDIDTEPLIQELLVAGVLVEYETGGRKYLHVKGFAKHQKINRPSAPTCPEYDDSLRTHAPLNEGSHRKGREGKGMEGSKVKTVSSAVESHHPPGAPPPTPLVLVPVEPSSPVVASMPVVGQGATGPAALASVTEADIASWQQAYPSLDVTAEVRKACAWIEANPDRRKTQKGVRRFLVNWLNRATDRYQGNGSRPAIPTAPHGKLDQAIARNLQRIEEEERRDQERSGAPGGPGPRALPHYPGE